MKILVVLLISTFIDLGLCCKGCVELSELTFEKIVKKFRTALVKFDQVFPHGDTHEAFEALANEINNKTICKADHSDIVVGMVSIKDYGELDNKYLGERFGAKTRYDFPIIKLFIDGDLENAIHFEIGKETVTTARLYTFLKANSKVHVQVPGCVKELDNFADNFVKSYAKRQKIMKDSEEFIANIECFDEDEKLVCEEKKKLLKTYVALMKGTLEKGEDFVAKQRERMTKLLKDKLSEKKLDELNKKLNIIASFKFPEPEKKAEL